MPKKSVTPLIILVLLLALALRLVNLNQSLWLDEAISFHAVKNFDFWGILTQFAPGDVHPPLYYLLLKVWTTLFGYSEIALRLPSVFAGILTTFFVFKIGQKLFSERAGLLAAFFLAINPLAIYYSQEARMYSLAALFVTVAVYFFLFRKWPWFLLFAAASIYTDYFPLLLFPFVFPALLPWLPTFWQQLTASAALARDVPLWGQVVGGLDLKSVLLVPSKFIFGRIPTQWWFVFPAAIYLWLLSRTKNLFLWTWLLVPILLGILISVKIPIFAYHRFLFVLPAFCLLLASVAGKRSIIFITIISFIANIIFIVNPAYHREDWRGTVQYFREKPGLVALPNLAQAAAIEYYAPELWIVESTLPRLGIVSDVYLVRYVQEIFDPEDFGRKTLEAIGYQRVEERSFSGGILVWHYQR